MTDQTAQEPTMEEILASIRRIISEDDAPAETAPGASAAEAAPDTQAEAQDEPDTQAAAEPQAAPEPVVSSDLMEEASPAQADAAEPAEEDVLELTDAYEAPAAESIGDLDVGPAEPEPFPASESVFAEAPAEAAPESAAPTTAYDRLVGDSAAASAASAFAGLASSLKKPEPMEQSTPAGPTLDELARSLLRPMLKEWLDANLPAIVEAEVRKEVERIARTAG